MSATAERAGRPADYARACVQLLRRRAAGAAAARATPLYERRAACFVTLKKHGELRGCIGTLEPRRARPRRRDRPQRALRGLARPALPAGAAPTSSTRSPARSTCSAPASRARSPTSTPHATA